MMTPTDAAVELPLVKFEITNETRIMVEGDGEPVTVTWREFLNANADGLGPEDAEEHRRELAQFGESKGGGGAAGAYTLKIAV